MSSTKMFAGIMAVTSALALTFLYATRPPARTPVVYAEASAVAALAARMHSLEQIQKAQAGSLGGLQADMQKAQRALTSLTAPPPGKGKDKKTETGSVKLK